MSGSELEPPPQLAAVTVSDSSSSPALAMALDQAPAACNHTAPQLAAVNRDDPWRLAFLQRAMLTFSSDGSFPDDMRRQIEQDGLALATAIRLRHSSPLHQSLASETIPFVGTVFTLDVVETYTESGTDDEMLLWQRQVRRSFVHERGVQALIDAILEDLDHDGHWGYIRVLGSVFRTKNAVQELQFGVVRRSMQSLLHRLLPLLSPDLKQRLQKEATTLQQGESPALSAARIALIQARREGAGTRLQQDIAYLLATMCFPRRKATQGVLTLVTMRQCTLALILSVIFSSIRASTDALLCTELLILLRHLLSWSANGVPLAELKNIAASCTSQGILKTVGDLILRLESDKTVLIWSLDVLFMWTTQTFEHKATHCVAAAEFKHSGWLSVWPVIKALSLHADQRIVKRAARLLSMWTLHNNVYHHQAVTQGRKDSREWEEGYLSIIQQEPAATTMARLLGWNDQRQSNNEPLFACPLRVLPSRCYNDGCPSTNWVAEQLLLCSKCKLAAYCSPDCQRQHWSFMHRSLCLA